MKNKLFKKVKLFVTMLLVGIIFAANSGVSAVAKTISVGSASYIDPYISNVGFHIKATKSGDYLYCVERWKNTVKNTTGTLVGEKDAGFTYIVKNGYPNKSFTGDKKKDYYITQAAIWWYIDEVNGNNSSLSKEFKSTATDKYNLRKHMKSLVEGALAAKKKGYAKTSISVKASNTSLTLSTDGSYYVSGNISVTSSNISKYKVELTNAPSGTIVVDSKGNKKTSFSSSEKFIVKVPVSKIKELKTSFSVKVSATGTVEKVYEYKPSDSKMQKFITVDLVKESTTVSDKLNLSISSSKVTIQKTDKATGKALAGAALVVKNSSGTVVHKFTSTSKAEVIYNLPNGKYTIEETSAPKGYEKLEKAVSFTVSDSKKDVSVTVANEVKKGVVTILKTDKATGKALAGAQLVLKNSKGTIIHKWTSTTQAEVIENLENGKYTIEETKAPSGYLKLDEAVSFTVSDSNKTINITVANEARESVVTITKIDKSTNLPLAGAVLVVKDQNGAEKARFTTTTESHTILDLPNGTYTVEEESAPAGYQKSDEIETFTIDDNNLTHQITFYNYPEVPVPDTASTSSIIMTLIGIIMIGATVGFVYKNAKQAK